MANDPEKEKQKEDDRDDTAIPGTSDDINGQIEADLAFKRRAEEVLEKLRSLNKPPAAEPERTGEKPKGTDKHK
jgi:hypothetical protein